jgi:predicted dehydrogenase
MPMLVSGLAPILAPIVGAQVLRFTSWQGVFIVLTMLGTLLLGAVAMVLRETLPPDRRRRGGISATVTTFWQLLKDCAFLSQQRGTGALGDLGCYVIDMARWFVGDIARVSAQFSTLVVRPHPDGQPYVPANDAAWLVIAFANSAQGTLAARVVAHQGERGQLNSVVLHGSHVTLELELQHTFRGATLQGAWAKEQQIRPLVIPAELWEGVDPATPADVTTRHSVGDRAFIDAIMDERRSPPVTTMAWKVQQMIEAAFTARVQGCTITIAGDADGGACSAT